MAKAPTERGYHPAMLTQSVFEELERIKEEFGLSSLSSAVKHLLDERTKPAKATLSSVEVEMAILFARATGTTAQRFRDYFGV